jgi:TonB family protein
MENFSQTPRLSAWLAGRFSSGLVRSAALLALGALFLIVPTAKAFSDPVRRTLIQRSNPEYPAMAKQLRIQGAVVLQIVIDPDGRVSDARLASGSDMLAEAAKTAVKKWKYEPSPESTTAFVRLVFSLD